MSVEIGVDRLSTETRTNDQLIPAFPVVIICRLYQSC